MNYVSLIERTKKKKAHSRGFCVCERESVGTVGPESVRREFPKLFNEDSTHSNSETVCRASRAEVLLTCPWFSNSRPMVNFGPEGNEEKRREEWARESNLLIGEMD